MICIKCHKFDHLLFAGEVRQYLFPVIPIVLNLSKDGLLEKIEKSPQQVFEGPMLNKKHRRVGHEN